MWLSGKWVSLLSYVPVALVTYRDVVLHRFRLPRLESTKCPHLPKASQRPSVCRDLEARVAQSYPSCVPLDPADVGALEWTEESHPNVVRQAAVGS